jgi:hypothetical protein
MRIFGMKRITLTLTKKCRQKDEGGIRTGKFRTGKSEEAGDYLPEDGTNTAKLAIEKARGQGCPRSIPFGEHALTSSPTFVTGLRG